MLNRNFWPFFKGYEHLISHYGGEKHKLMVFIIFVQQIPLLNKYDKTYKMHGTYYVKIIGW